MELSAFTSELGFQSGRLQPSAADAGIRLDGDWLFVLGHDAPGFTGLFKASDYVDVSQSGVNFSTNGQIVFWPRTRPTATAVPSGFSWLASILVDGTIIESRAVSGLVPMDWQSWTLDLTQFAGGIHIIGFRLTLQGPTPTPPASPLTEIEVPGFYVENIRGITPIGPTVVNAIPDFGQGISGGPPAAADGTITFQIVGFGGSSTAEIDTTTIDVTVNGQPAMAGGVPALGWTGSVVQQSYPDLRTMVSLTPVTPFLSGDTVNMSVAASTLSGLHLGTNPTTWSFAIADTTPPLIVGASAQATTVVRVTWTEAVVASTPLGAHDALNPSLYTFVPVIDAGGTVPAYTPSVVSIAPVDGQADTFDLTTDSELSPGITYQLAANGVADPSGNFEIALAVFVAFFPPPPRGRIFNLWKLLPRKNREEDVTQDLARFVACLQEPAGLLLNDIDHWTDILDVDVAAEEYLDAMLLDLGNPFPFTLSVTDKRRLIRLLVPIYQQKGTPDGIINTVRFFLGLTITIEPYDGEGMELGVSELGVDWILGPGTSFALYAFRIVSGISLTDEQTSQITFIANYMKPAHTHLIEIVQPSAPPPYDPVELGVSELGVDWILH